MAGSDPSGLVPCGDICAPPKAQQAYDDAVARNNAASAESQHIDGCGERRGCILQTTRNYQDPGYAAAQAAAWEAEQEYKAEVAAQEAARQAAAVAAVQAAQAQHHSWWNTVSDFVGTAALVLTVAAIATSWVPGLDVVTAGLALAAEGANLAFGAVSAVNAGIDYSHGDIAGGTANLAFAALSIGGAGLLGKAAKGLNAARATEDALPIVKFSRARAPGLAQNFDDAVAGGAPTRLTRVSAAAKAANRRAALRGLKPAGSGMSWDEYPFASSAQGGAGAWVSRPEALAGLPGWCHE